MSGNPLRDLCETAYVNAALEKELRRDVRAGTIRGVVASLLNAHPSDPMLTLTTRVARTRQDRQVIDRARGGQPVTRAAWLVAHYVEPIRGDLQQVPPPADVPPDLVATAWIMPRTRIALAVVLGLASSRSTCDHLATRYTNILLYGDDRAGAAAGLLAMLAPKPR